MKKFEIEALVRLTWIQQGSRAVVEDGEGLRNLVLKERVRIVREVTDADLEPVVPTAEQLAGTTE